MKKKKKRRKRKKPFPFTYPHIISEQLFFIFLYFKVRYKLKLLKYFILIKFKNISENNYVSI